MHPWGPRSLPHHLSQATGPLLHGVHTQPSNISPHPAGPQDTVSTLKSTSHLLRLTRRRGPPRSQFPAGLVSVLYVCKEPLKMSEATGEFACDVYTSYRPVSVSKVTNEPITFSFKTTKCPAQQNFSNGMTRKRQPAAEARNQARDSYLTADRTARAHSPSFWRQLLHGPSWACPSSLLPSQRGCQSRWPRGG